MKGDKAQTKPERRTPPLRETHEGRQMGDKAQTRPERRTPPLRETHKGRQMKGDKAQRTGGHHHSGRHMKGDKAQTRPERRTPPRRETHAARQGTVKTGEADTTTQGDT